MGWAHPRTELVAPSQKTGGVTTHAAVPTPPELALTLTLPDIWYAPAPAMLPRPPPLAASLPLTSIMAEREGIEAAPTNDRRPHDPPPPILKVPSDVVKGAITF